MSYSIGASDLSPAHDCCLQVDPYFLPYFMCQYLFIVVAPVFFAAAIYLALSWLLLGVSGRHKPPVSPRLILIIFVCFDIVCTIIQVAGAASIGTAESNDQDPSPANDVLITGLAIQVAAFLDFLVVSWWSLHACLSASHEAVTGPLSSLHRCSVAVRSAPCNSSAGGASYNLPSQRTQPGGGRVPLLS